MFPGPLSSRFAALRFLSVSQLSRTINRNVLVPATLAVAVLFFAATHLRAESVIYEGEQSTLATTGLGDPSSVITDSHGNIYIADAQNNDVIEIAAGTGTQSTVAISGVTPSTLSDPTDLAVDGAGNLYIADSGNNRVVAVPAGGGAAHLVGSGLSDPTGIAVYGSDVYVVDAGHSRVMKFASGGIIGTQVVGSLSSPYGIGIDGSGNVYISETAADDIIKIASGGGQSTVGVTGLSSPKGINVDSSGDILIADSGNNRVLEYNAISQQLSIGSGLNSPSGLTLVDSLNGVPTLLIADSGNQRVVDLAITANLGSAAVGSPGTSNQRLLVFNFQTPETLTAVNVVTQGASNLDFTAGAGTTCVTAHAYAVDDLCAVQVDFSPKYPGLREGAVDLESSGGTLITTDFPGIGTGPQIAFGTGTPIPLSFSGIAIAAATDDSGNLYIGDQFNQRVVKITPGGTQTIIATGIAQPSGIAVDALGNVYIADTTGGRVLKVTPNGTQSTVSVTGLGKPFGVAVDGAGDLYISDSTHNDVIKVQGGSQSTVSVTGLSNPEGIALDSAGNLYIADNANNRIVKITPANVQTTVSATGVASPTGVAVDAAGDIYVANDVNVLFVPAGGGAQQTVDNAGVSAVAVDQAGNLYAVTPAMTKFSSAPPSLSFASTAVGATSSDSPKFVTAVNIGNKPLNLTGLSATTNFNLDTADSTCTSSTVLASGASCNLAVEFAPVSGGTLSGTLNVTDNSLNAAAPSYAEQQVSLNGTGIGPAYAATIALSENPGPSVNVGTSVAVTATLTGQNGTPTGNISYTIDGGKAQTAALSAGVAQFTLPGTLSVGTHTIIVNYAGDADYTVASTPQQFTLTIAAIPPSFTLASSASTLTIQNGQSGSVQLTLTPSGGFTGPVHISCSGLPPSAACSTLPTSITLNGSTPVNVTLNINTAAQQAWLATPAVPAQTPFNPILPALALWWPGSLAGLSLFRRRRNRSAKQNRWIQLCVLVLLLGGLAAGITGCGSSSTNTSQITVTATGTSGSTTATQTFSLTLNVNR